jgi:NitT/TauT family transport system substrate-binding protein
MAPCEQWSSTARRRCPPSAPGGRRAGGHTTKGIALDDRLGIGRAGDTGRPALPARAGGARRGRSRRWVATAVAFALGAGAACSGDGADDDGGSGDQAAEVQLRIPRRDDLGRGCDDAAETEIDDLAADRPVARCAPGSPEAVPLPGAATPLRVGIRGTTEDLAPLLLADRFGEFAAENLDVTFETYGDAPSLFDALDAGEVDAVAGELDAPFFDLVAEHGRDGTPGPRLILGGPVAARPNDLSTPQPGLWVRSSVITEANRWRDLEDERVAVEDSIADVVAAPITALLRQDDISLNEVRLAVIDGQQAADELASGDLAAAWLSEPYWRQVAGDEEIELVATLPATESLGGVVASPALVEARPVAVAFGRAVIRTINTYLPGDDQDDDEVVEALADATGESVDDRSDTPPWIFDWEIRAGTTTRIQTPLINYGAVVYESELPESRIVDRTIATAALGIEPSEP